MSQLFGGDQVENANSFNDYEQLDQSDYGGAYVEAKGNGLDDDYARYAFSTYQSL